MICFLYFLFDHLSGNGYGNITDLGLHLLECSSALLGDISRCLFLDGNCFLLCVSNNRLTSLGSTLLSIGNDLSFRPSAAGRKKGGTLLWEENLRPFFAS